MYKKKFFITLLSVLFLNGCGGEVEPLFGQGVVDTYSKSIRSNWQVSGESSLGILSQSLDQEVVEIKLQKGAEVGEHIQLFIDSDHDSTTGYQDDLVNGADYLIEEDVIFKSTANDDSWSWEVVGNSTFTNNQNIFYVSTTTNLIQNLSTNFRVGAISWNGVNWDQLISYIPMKPIGESRGLIISEVMASNAHTIMDPDFLAFSDWIELYNDSANPIDISNYKLSDKIDEASWSIPANTVINAHSHMIFWADKEDTVKKGYHTDFSLKSKGESVALFDANENFITGFTFPKQVADISCSVDEGGNIVYMNPTPKNQNSNTFETLSLSTKPTFSLSSGFYNNTQTLSLSVNGVADIYYTTDGSFPTINSSRYVDPILIDKTMVVRARALENGKFLSSTATNSYFIGENISLPVVSISTDDRYLNDNKVGIYVVGTNGAVSPGCEEGPQVANFYQEWTRPANIDYFDKNGVLGFSQEFDLKISGSCSRILPQKSLSIKADSKYGKSYLNYKLFPNKNINKIKSFKLKSAGQDWEGTLLRDAFMQQVIKDDMDVEYQDYRPSIVFINGQYWGIHNIREKKNKYFLAENHPEVNPKKLDLLKDEGSAHDGKSDDYIAMLDFIKNNPLSNQDNYNIVASQMDIENYIDYIIAESYFANTDWPYTNVRFWRDQNGGKWRWILEDLDQGLGEPWGDFITVNMLDLLTNTNNIGENNPLWSTFLFRSLLENPTFKSRFKQKYNSYLNSTFQTNRVLGILDSITAKISPEIARHTQKWGATAPYVFKDFEEWSDNVAHLKDVIQTRNDTVRGELSNF